MRACLGRALRTRVRRRASPVTATTDFLAPDILNKRGRAVPAVPHALGRTRTTDAEGPPHQLVSSYRGGFNGQTTRRPDAFPDFRYHGCTCAAVQTCCHWRRGI